MRWHYRIPELAGIIDNVYPAMSPLCHRSGSSLKEWFRKARSDFTEAHGKWTGSRQNDPDRFPIFLSTFNGNLTALSRRLLVFFIACRCGTESEDVQYLDMSSALMTAVDRTGYEEAWRAMDNAEVEIPDGISIPSSYGSRKRRKAENDISIMKDELASVAVAIKGLQPAQKEEDAEMEQIRRQSEVMGLIGKAR